MKKKLRIEKKILMGLAMFIHSFTLTKSYNMGKMVTYLKKNMQIELGELAQSGTSRPPFLTISLNYFINLGWL